MAENLLVTLSRIPALVALGALVCLMNAASAEPVCDALTPLLSLPFEAGTSHRVTKGAGQEPSHLGTHRYAWDFDMPEGTPVVAAASGTVVAVIDDRTRGGPDPSFANEANLIVVDHGRNRFSVYQHLRARGARVHEGDRVSRGQLLGLSGSTGWSTAPHLHFTVINERNESIPVCFESMPDRVPVQGQSYQAARPRVDAQAPTVSLLPAEEYEANGILIDSEVPSRWLTRHGPPRIVGRLIRPAARVAAFFLPWGSPNAVKWTYARVDASGHFEIVVDTSGLNGPYDFAMAIPSEDGHFHSDFGVAVSIHPR